MTEPTCDHEGTFQIEMYEGMTTPDIIDLFTQTGLAGLEAMRKAAKDNDDRQTVARIVIVSAMLKEHFDEMIRIMNSDDEEGSCE